MRYRTVIFDFDGTLADTERAMQESLNALASEFGFSRIADEEKSVLRKMNAREFLTRRLGIPIWHLYKVLRLVRRGRREFATRSGEVRLFPRVPEMLRTLHVAGYRVGIVSTNTVTVMCGILGDSNADIDFLRSGSLLLGKSRALKRVLRQCGRDQSPVVYVGDEVRDAKTCRAVGIAMIGVGWGLNDAHTLRNEGIEVAETLEELSEKILAQ